MTIDIEKLKEILEEIDLIEDDDLTKLKELKGNRINLAKLFVKCFDLLNDNLYQFKEEEENVKKYLSEFNVKEIRILVEEFDGELGSYYKGEKIKRIVDLSREKFNGLIQNFFKLFGDED